MSDKNYKSPSIFKFFDDKKGIVPISLDMREAIVGKSIVEIKTPSTTELILILNDGTELIAQSNEGCGGCNNGWFEYDINDVITLGLEGNVITNVHVNCDIEKDAWGDDSGKYTIQIFSLDKRYNIDFAGYDNGYYGIGISLQIKLNE